MTIKPDVQTNHLRQYPAERALISPLISSFDINWARNRSAYNTRISCYILDPKPFIKETFGFSSELALFITPFDDIQPRTFQAIFQFLHEDPIRGRVDKSVFLLVLPNGQIKKEINILYNQLYDGRIPILIDKGDLLSSQRDSWGMRNIIAQEVFTRDLFDYQLPLRDDYGFFGRESLIFDFSEAISKGQNRGLFGLRKTGKTSLLFKIARNLQHKENVKTIYYDCKKTRIRKMSSEQLIDEMCGDILKAMGRDVSFGSGKAPYERIETIFATISDKTKICIIFDEIEYISYFSSTNSHWRQDFIDFWQTLWSIQSETGKLCFILGGVNAKVVEDDNVDGIQNPLFGIVPSFYLRGLDLDEVRKMVRLLGKRMGLSFDEDAIVYVHERYGGHPLLTRKACSFINSYFQSMGVQKPINVKKDTLKENIHHIDEEIKYYFSHILSEIRKFYLEEYEILEMLCSGQKWDAMELLKSGYQADHLKNYGLIEIAPSGLATFTINCLENYISLETARSEGRRLLYREVKSNTSAAWLKARLIAISRDLSSLSQVSEKECGYSILPSHELCKPDQFFSVTDVTTEAEWESCLLSLYQSLVECIERAGKSARKPDFFFQDFKRDFPFLQEAVQRIRAYRNSVAHLALQGKSQDSIDYFMQKDFGSKDYVWKTIDDIRIAQQHVLSELMIAIQHESSRKSP